MNRRTTRLMSAPKCSVIFLAALFFLVFGEWKNEVRFKLDSSGIRKAWNKTRYTAIPELDSYHSWERDHCWRNRTVGNRTSYDILVTGAGYSATGYFAKTFTLAGYPVGHEKLEKLGTSDWLMASRKNNMFSPFLFKLIFLLVRHPLKVLHSEYGTKWRFVYTKKITEWGPM